MKQISWPPSWFNNTLYATFLFGAAIRGVNLHFLDNYTHKMQSVFIRPNLAREKLYLSQYRQLTRKVLTASFD